MSVTCILSYRNTLLTDPSWVLWATCWFMLYFQRKMRSEYDEYEPQRGLTECWIQYKCEIKNTKIFCICVDKLTCRFIHSITVGGIFDGADLKVSVRYNAVSFLCVLHSKMKWISFENFSTSTGVKAGEKNCLMFSHLSFCFLSDCIRDLPENWVWDLG